VPNNSKLSVISAVDNTGKLGPTVAAGIPQIDPAFTLEFRTNDIPTIGVFNPFQNTNGFV
jgi:hypothetical protein